MTVSFERKAKRRARKGTEEKMQVLERDLAREQLGVARRGVLYEELEARLIGASRWAAQARAQVIAHASHDNTVVLEGESGTGKEFLARLIHKCSVRCDGPFVTISFESVSDESVEAALFGSVRILPGGARHIHRGLVESAEGGVIYIADVSELSFSTRAKVLRLVQQREFQRVGESSILKSDVRVMTGLPSSTGARAVKDWVLVRNDLAVRDTVFIPSLRERPDDVEPLAKHFVRQLCEETGKELRSFAPEVLEVLSKYCWPGNVAELKNVVEHLVYQSGPPVLTASLLPGGMMNGLESGNHALPATGIDLANEVQRYEKSLICAALKRCMGVQSRAANMLGLKPTTLNMKLKSYGIDVETFK
jgi:DNA-binding NtrC family response regulator